MLKYVKLFAKTKNHGSASLRLRGSITIGKLKTSDLTISNNTAYHLNHKPKDLNFNNHNFNLTFTENVLNQLVCHITE